MAKTYVLSWKLPTTADQATAWRLMRDTDTFNRVAQMGFRFTERVKADGSVERIGKVSRFGLKIPWIEKPYNFDEPRRWSTERVFLGGPVDRYVVSMELVPADTGCTIHYKVEFWPRGAVMMPVVKVDANTLVTPKLDKTLRRCQRFLNGELTEFDLTPPPLSTKQKQRLHAGLAELTSARAAKHLTTLIEEAPLARQNMIHPLKLARAWKLPAEEVVRACFEAVRGGALTMHWQLMCPSCRMPKNDVAALTLSLEEPHCSSCNIRYDGAFPDSVAVTFRPDKKVRAIDLPIECLGSPGRTPSVVAHAEVEAGATFNWELALLPGSYSVRTWPELETASLQVRRDIDQHLLTLTLGPQAVQPPLLRLGPGKARVRIRNRMASAMRVAVQRRPMDDRLLTAGRLLEIEGVRQWLPDGALSPHLHASVALRAVVAVWVQRGGDTARGHVVTALQEHGPAALHDGDDMVVAAFPSILDALRAGENVEGSTHLAAAMVHGPITLLREGDKHVPSGATVQRATQLARSTDAGRYLLIGSGLDAALDAVLDEQAGIAAVDQRDGTRTVRYLDRTLQPLVHIEPRPLRPGDVVDDRFRIGERVGTGGFGAVFAATDAVTGEHVVVKVLRPRIAEDAVQVQRFFNEGHVTSQLSSPFIARTIDFGLGVDGRLYLAMERLHGHELADELRNEGPLSPNRAIAVCIDALHGLQHAHDAGLIHRDIKPANMFVCEGPDPVVKLIDFGIALLADKDERQDTDTRTAIGTPHYMSPEQAQASVDIDHRSDLFSLGVVLYEAIAGNYPFHGTTTLAVLLARIRAEPVPIGTAVSQQLPTGLQDAVMRALQRKPGLRFATAAEMAVTLADIAEGRGKPDSSPRKQLAATHLAKHGRSSQSGPGAPGTQQLEPMTEDVDDSERVQLAAQAKRVKTQILLPGADAVDPDPAP